MAIHEIYGYTVQDIIDLVCNYVGRDEVKFKDYLKSIIPLAEARIISLHDWSYMYDTGLKLNIQADTNTYFTTALTNRFNQPKNMEVENISLIYHDVPMKKVLLNDIRNHEVAKGKPSMWAPLTSREIIIYPTPKENMTLFIDGKINLIPLTTVTSYPTIPYKYQESFIAYIIALALERDNDDRARAKKQEAFALIQSDMRKDAEVLSRTSELRIKHWTEEWLFSTIPQNQIWD